MLCHQLQRDTRLCLRQNPRLGSHHINKNVLFLETRFAKNPRLLVLEIPQSSSQTELGDLFWQKHRCNFLVLGHGFWAHHILDLLAYQCIGLDILGHTSGHARIFSCVQVTFSVFMTNALLLTPGQEPVECRRHHCKLYVC